MLEDIYTYLFRICLIIKILTLFNKNFEMFSTSAQANSEIHVSQMFWVSLMCAQITIFDCKTSHNNNRLLLAPV